MNNSEMFEKVYGVKPGYYHCILGIACNKCKYSDDSGHRDENCFLKFWNDEYGNSPVKEGYTKD